MPDDEKPLVGYPVTVNSLDLLLLAVTANEMRKRYFVDLTEKNEVAQAILRCTQAAKDQKP